MVGDQWRKVGSGSRANYHVGVVYSVTAVAIRIIQNIRHMSTHLGPTDPITIRRIRRKFRTPSVRSCHPMCSEFGPLKSNASMGFGGVRSMCPYFSRITK